MRGHAILTAAAERADPERAIAMLADAASACFYAGNAAEMLSVAEKARAILPNRPSIRARFLAAIAVGMARILGGDAAAGATAIHEAIALAENSAGLRGDPQMLPWLAVGPIFLRETGAGRLLLEHTVNTARARAAVGFLPFVLNLIGRDHATPIAGRSPRHLPRSDRPGTGSGQRTELTFGLAGLACCKRAADGSVSAGAGPPKRSALAMSLGWGSTRSGRRRRSASWNSDSATRSAPLRSSNIKQQLLRDLRSPTLTSRPRQSSSRPT